MGCDIHMHVEVKVSGKWEHWAAPNVERSYQLFGKLAGVRRPEVGAISEPKGLPEDLSLLTQMDLDKWDGDGHSHSWLGADEIKQVSDWLDKLPGKFGGLEYAVLHTYLFGNSLAGPKVFAADYPDAVEDVRLVFWFDN